jgi:copper chaperone CopZ
MRTIRIATTGMYCPSCPMLIELSVCDLPGVAEVQVSSADCRTVVTYDELQTTAETILDGIRNAGYGAECVA